MAMDASRLSTSVVMKEPPRTTLSRASSVQSAESFDNDLGRIAANSSPASLRHRVAINNWGRRDHSLSPARPGTRRKAVMEFPSSGNTCEFGCPASRSRSSGLVPEHQPFWLEPDRSVRVLSRRVRRHADRAGRHQRAATDRPRIRHPRRRRHSQRHLSNHRRSHSHGRRRPRHRDPRLALTTFETGGPSESNKFDVHLALNRLHYL